jgi:ribonuclease HI
VDAACDMTTGVMEYRGVDTETAAEIFRMGPFQDSSNNLGEFLAVVHALAFMKERSMALPVYTDSKTALAWVRNKKAKTTVQRTSGNALVFELIARAETWLRNNTYPNLVLKWETEQWGEVPADFGRK